MKQGLFAVVLLGALLGGLGGVSAQTLEVHGRVLDEDDRPVRGASVELQPIFPLYERSLEVMDGLLFPEPDARVLTSAEGEYVLPVPGPGMWHVEIWAEGKIPLRHELIPLLESRVLPPAILTADAGIDVRVQDRQGKPLAAAKVWWRLEPGSEPPTRRPSRRDSEGWVSRGRIGDTDESGHVRLSRRADQKLRVHAYAIGYLPSDGVAATDGSATVSLEKGRPYGFRVLEPSGDPAAEVLVQIGDPPWNHGTTDEHGQITVFLLPDRPQAFGMIRSDGQIETGMISASEEELAQKSDEYEELTLPAPIVVEGTVVDDRFQEALEGVWVWEQRDPGLVYLTDRRGRFQLNRGSGSRWWIGAAAPGYRPTGTLVRRQAKGFSSNTLILSQSTGLPGRVVDIEGTAVEGAQVVAYPAESSIYGDDPPTAWTDPQGGFRLQDLAQEEIYELVVTAEGFAPTRKPLRPSEAERVEIVLDRGRAVTGRIVTEQGALIVGAEVAVVPNVTDWRHTRRIQRSSRNEPAPTTFTDTDGSFWIGGLPEIPLALVVAAQGHASRLMQQVEFTPPDPIADVGDIVLRPGVAVRGIVVDRAGEPVAAAEVDITRSSYSWSMARQALDPRGELTTIVTDKRGRFAIEGFMQGEPVSLMVMHDDFVHYDNQRVEAGGDQPIRIVLERAARIAGRIETEWGEIPPEFRITATTTLDRSLTNTPGWSNSTGARTDAEGEFLIANVQPGRVEITGRGGGYIANPPLEVELAAGQEITDLVLRLVKASELSGRVSDERGRPVVQARVSLLEESRRQNRGFSRPVGMAVTDADGRYRFDSLDASRSGISVKVDHDDYRPLEKRLELEQGANTLDLVLESGLTVSGSVVAETGEPVGGASVGLEGGQGGFSSNDLSHLSLDDGSFEIAGVAPGTYRLFAVKEGYARSYRSEPVEVSDSSDARGLTVCLSRGGTLRGTITGVEAEDLTSIHLNASAKDGNQWAQGSVEQSGEYRIDNVGFEEGTVAAYSQALGRSVSEEFTLDTDGGETWVDLEFGTGGSTLSGVVLVDGAPLSEGQVMVRGGLTSSGIGPVDSSGRFQIQGLDNGPHTVSVYLHSGSNITDIDTVEVVGDTEVTLEIDSIRVVGRVVAADTGEPIADAVVSVRRASGWFSGRGEETTTGRNGEFELRVAAEGQAVSLQAQAEGYAQKTLPLDLSAGPSISGVEFALVGGGEVELDVRMASGLKADAVSVAVLDRTGRIQYADTLTGGGSENFLLRSIPPGTWTLLVLAHGGAVVSTPITAPGPTVSVIVPPESRIEVDLSGVSGLSGSEKLRLLTPSGDPFPFPIGNGILYQLPIHANPSTLHWVPAGNWIVELIDETGQSRSQPVTTIAGQTTQVVMN